jgi:hypothetical protein
LEAITIQSDESEYQLESINDLCTQGQTNSDSNISNESNIEEKIKKIDEDLIN